MLFWIRLDVFHIGDPDCEHEGVRVSFNMSENDGNLSALMDAMLELLPEDEVPGSLFLGLFLKRLPV